MCGEVIVCVKDYVHSGVVFDKEKKKNPEIEIHQQSHKNLTTTSKGELKQ